MTEDKKITGISENLADSIKKEAPIDFNHKDKKTLSGIKVAISISENEDLEDLGLSKNHLKDMMIEMARYLIANSATLVYGGDLSKEGYTELFTELSYQYKSLNDSSSNFINYFSFPYGNSLDINIQADFVEKRVDPIILSRLPHLEEFDSKTKYEPFSILEDRYILSESLSNMREIMSKESNVRVLLGGKQNGFSGYSPGIIEEAYYTLKENKPVFIIGGFGGAAKSLSKMICGEHPKELTNEVQYTTSFMQEFRKKYCQDDKLLTDYDKLFQFFKDYGIEKLSETNGLTIGENEILFESQNIYEIIFLVMKGIKLLTN